MFFRKKDKLENRHTRNRHTRNRHTKSYKNRSFFNKTFKRRSRKISSERFCHKQPSLGELIEVLYTPKVSYNKIKKIVLTMLGRILLIGSKIFVDSLGTDDILPLFISCCIFGQKRCLLQTFNVNTTQMIENVFDLLPNKLGNVANALILMNSATLVSQKHFSHIKDDIEHIPYHYILKYVKTIQSGVDDDMKQEIKTLFTDILTSLRRSLKRVSRRKSIGGANQHILDISLDNKQKDSLINLPTHLPKVFDKELKEIINKYQNVPIFLPIHVVNHLFVEVQKLQSLMNHFFEKHFIYKSYNFKNEELKQVLYIDD